MSRSLRTHGMSVARRLALLGGTGLLLLACGSGLSAEVDTAATNDAQLSPVQPTAVPTTAPLFLPPADTSLPALAPLPAEPAATGVGADAPVTETNPLDAATGGTATTNESPAITTTDAQGAVAAPPAQVQAAVQSSSQAVDPLEITSTGSWSDCVLAAAQNTNAASLLDPIAAGSTIDLTSVQLNTLAAASVGCDIVTNSLVTTDVGDYLPTASSCLNAWLESSGGGSVFVGLTSIDWGQPTPAWAQPYLVDALDACFTGTSFAADVMAVVSVDPSLSGAFDGGCLASSFDTSGTMRTFAQALAADPSTANLYVGLDDGWVLSCANVGQMVAVAAAADGVALSTSTVSCIDSELKSAGVVAALVAGTADNDAVGIATIACLTNAEAAALLG